MKRGVVYKLQTLPSNKFGARMGYRKNLLACQTILGICRPPSNFFMSYLGYQLRIETVMGDTLLFRPDCPFSQPIQWCRKVTRAVWDPWQLALSASCRLGSCPLGCLANSWMNAPRTRRMFAEVKNSAKLLGSSRLYSGGS